jgi:hypothetical protein
MTDDQPRTDTFQLIYDGSDIHDGEMDVSVLAPALLAMGELFKAADETINGSHTVVTTSVKADFREGSFEVLLSIEQHVREAAVAALPSLHLLGADKLISTVIGETVDKGIDKAKEVVVKGLFKLMGKLAGAKPKSIKRDDSKTTYIFNMGNNNSFHVDARTTELYENTRTRSAAIKVALPLSRTGIRTLKMKRHAEEVTSLERRDFPEIDNPLLLDSLAHGDALLLAKPEPQVIVVKIVKTNFGRGKWSVSDGGRRYEVSMDDDDFKERVHAREIGFYDGDFYRVKMVTTQKLKGRVMTTSRSIIEVIEPVRDDLQNAHQESLALSNQERKAGRRFRVND